MKDKILVRGDLLVVCPECGLQFPVSVSDLINEKEVTCPAGQFTAHIPTKTEGKGATAHTCTKDDCKTKFEYHKFKLDKTKIVQIW